MTGHNVRPLRRGAALHAAIGTAIFAVAFLYLFAHPSFPNDHFDHLAKARQVLHGEYPVRDFLDPGRPLTIGLSAAALRASGDTLFGEAVLTSGAIALGVALVYWLALALGGSVVFALWAAACTLAIEPRLYNYPKVVVPMVAVWLVFRYLDRPGPGRAAAIGVWGAAGFLFRHDLGVYLAVFATAGLLLGRGVRDARSLARDAAACGCAAAAVAAPYLWFLLGAGALAASGAEGGAALAGAAGVTWRGFQLWPSAGAASGWIRHDAETWIYDLFLVVPVVATGLVARTARRSTLEGQRAVALAILCATLVLFLIRGDLDSRLPDVAAPSFVLAAWLLALLAGPWGTWRASRGRTAAVAAAAVLALVTWASVSALAEWSPARRLAGTIVRLPGSVTDSARRLRADPLTTWEEEGTTGARGLARWLRECTAPDERVLIVGYHPEVFFYARRLFAGGMLFFHAGYFSSPADQRLTVERLERQTVPFVVVEEGEAPALEETYAVVGDWVRSHYTAAFETDFGGGRRFEIRRGLGSDPIPGGCDRRE